MLKIETGCCNDVGSCVILNIVKRKEKKMEEEKRFCYYCGCEVNSKDVHIINGKDCCEECFDNDFVNCDCCGDLVYNENSCEANDNLYCQSCFEELYTHCDMCGETIRINERYLTELNNDVYCENCYYETIGECENCGHDYYRDDTYNDYCLDCQKSELLGEYHRMKDNGDYDMCYTAEESNKNKTYFGIELEVDNGSYLDETLSELDDILNRKRRLVCFEEDGSLGCEGFEIITQPMTFNFIKQNEDIFKSALRCLIRNGYVSHNTEQCGLHIHFSRSAFVNRKGKYDKESEDRLVLLSEVFRRELEGFCRRGSCNYACFMSNSNDYDGMNLKKIKDIKEVDKSKDRYYVFNFTNYNTVEFRLPRGTLRFETIMATVELLKNLIHFATRRNETLIGLSWEDIINYNRSKNKYLVQYCKDRGIVKTDSIINFSSMDIKPTLKKMESLIQKKGSLVMDVQCAEGRNYNFVSRRLEEEI